MPNKSNDFKRVFVAGHNGMVGLAYFDASHRWHVYPIMVPHDHA